MVKTLSSNAGVQVRSLVWELRSYMPHGQKTKAENRSNIVTNSIKTSKMAHIQKKIKCNSNSKIFLMNYLFSISYFFLYLFFPSLN